MVVSSGSLRWMADDVFDLTTDDARIVELRPNSAAVLLKEMKLSATDEDEATS